MTGHEPGQPDGPGGDDIVAQSPLMYFGRRWDAPILDLAQPIDTPVGERCCECGEQVVEGDRGWIRAAFRSIDDGGLQAVAEPVHAECDLLTTMGHMVGVCPCTGYDHDRAAAREVWQRVERLKAAADRLN